MKVSRTILLAATFLPALCGCSHSEDGRGAPAGVSATEKTHEIEANPHMSAEQKAAAEQQMSAAAAQARAQAASQRTTR